MDHPSKYDFGKLTDEQLSEAAKQTQELVFAIPTWNAKLARGECLPSSAEARAELVSSNLKMLERLENELRAIRKEQGVRATR